MSRRWHVATEGFWRADVHGIDPKTTVILSAQILKIGVNGVLAVRSDMENSVG